MPVLLSELLRNLQAFDQRSSNPASKVLNTRAVHADATEMVGDTSAAVGKLTEPNTSCLGDQKLASDAASQARQGTGGGEEMMSPSIFRPSSLTPGSCRTSYVSLGEIELFQAPSTDTFGNSLSGFIDFNMHGFSDCPQSLLMLEVGHAAELETSPLTGPLWPTLAKAAASAQENTTALDVNVILESSVVFKVGVLIILPRLVACLCAAVLLCGLIYIASDASVNFLKLTPTARKLLNRTANKRMKEKKRRRFEKGKKKLGLFAILFFLMGDVLGASRGGVVVLGQRKGGQNTLKGAEAASRARSSTSAVDAGSTLAAAGADLNVQNILENVSGGAQGCGGEDEHLLDLHFGALLLEDKGMSVVVGLEEGFDNADERGAGGEGRRLTSDPVSDQTALFYKISVSDKGDSEMSNGDEVVISEGVYTCTCDLNGNPLPSVFQGESQFMCGTCYNNVQMFYILHKYGKIRCAEDNFGCELDGAGNRQIMQVSQPGGTVTLRGLHFFRGKGGGGGLYLYGDSPTIHFPLTVVVELSLFTRCSRGGGFGGAIKAYDGTLHLFAVSFSSNTGSPSSSSSRGDDIYANYASVTIHSTCPDDESGSPIEGEMSKRPLAPLHFPTNPTPSSLIFASSLHAHRIHP